MRYLIKFTKESMIKYVSHLDLMRTIQRMIRRSELPVKYSQGFNPHVILSIAQPLPVGVYSKGEYMDLNFEDILDEDYIKDKLNLHSPMGIKILDVITVEENLQGKKVPPSMAAVDAAEYILKFSCNDSEMVKKEIEKLLNVDVWKILKKSKKNEKEVNIKPLIKKFSYKIKDEKLFLSVMLASSSKENLSSQLLGEFIKNNALGINKEAFIDIERQEMLGLKGKRLVPLSTYFK